MKNNGQSGFTLVELAIVLAIVGLLVGGGLSMYRPFDRISRIEETKNKQEKIARAVSDYAIRYNVIPCPASPADETGLHQTGCDTNVNEQFGIVPYKTLGIPAEWAIDGWGRYMSYNVNPVYVSIAAKDNVHEHCRKNSWIDTSVPENVYAEKAKFCCATWNAPFPLSNDFILSSNAADLNGSRVVAVRAGILAHFNTEETGASPANSNSQAIAYLLISHGEDGGGAYIPNSFSATRFNAGNDTGNSEKENLGNNDANIRQFMMPPYNGTKGINHFDDIILWRTPDLIMSENGGSSCAVP